MCSIMPAGAQSPIGEWVVQDGTARIRIVPCGNTLWGVISWTKGSPGEDQNNPDPSKRGQSLLGTPILLDLKPGEHGRWDGQVYNPEDGETYTAHISLEGPDILKIEGCALGGLFCGGQNWRRFHQSSESGQPTEEVCSRVGSKS